MYKLAIISQKGGAGKTTLAINLAVASELAGRTAAVIDLDPQASACCWKDLRTHSNWPAVIDAKAARLKPVLEEAERLKVELAILDTAPNSESAVLAAANAADIVLIPAKPGILDLHSISFTIYLATKVAQRPAFVVLTMVHPTGGQGTRAAEAIRSNYGIEIAPVQIRHRAAYSHSLASGQAVQEFEPGGKAAEEIKQLDKWARKQFWQ